MDAESLALYAEGQLSRRRAAQVRTHLSGCAACATTQQQLRAVSTMLREVPAAPLPSAVAARLDAVLGAESARRAAELAVPGPAAPHAQPAPAGPDPARRPRRPRRWAPGWSLRSPALLRGLAVAGTLVVVVGGSLGVAGLLSGHRSGSGTAGPAAQAPAISGGAPGSARPPVIQSSTHYTTANLSRQAALTLHASQLRRGGALPAHPAGLSTNPGGPNVRPGSGSRTGAPSPGRPALSSQLASCVRAVTGGPVTLVEHAYYNGKRAFVLIQAAHPGQPGRVWVVGPGCAAGHIQLLARAQLSPSG